MISFARGEAFQNAISGVVAMPVVDRFETVEIENHRAERVSARPIEKRAEMGFEATAIFQPGQRIGRRHFDRGFDIVAQTVGISLPPDLRAHASGKFAAIDRAQDIVVHAKIEAAQDLPAILGVGDRQHRDLAGALLESEPRAKPEPVVVREIETDDEEIVIAGGTRVERLAAIAFEFDIMVFPQGVLDELRRRRRILDEHDAPAGAVVAVAPVNGSPIPSFDERRARLRNSSRMSRSLESEWTRARSAISSIGLERKSSAPASSPRIRSEG